MDSIARADNPSLGVRMRGCFLTRRVLYFELPRVLVFTSSNVDMGLQFVFDSVVMVVSQVCFPSEICLISCTNDCGIIHSWRSSDSAGSSL